MVDLESKNKDKENIETTAEKGLDLKEIKNELLVVEILDLMDELLLYQSKLEKEMKKGFVELAQAKYVLGPSVMTRANYDKRMTARYLLAQGESTTLIKNPEESKDPLNWYGVLVPGCLRKSQNNFYSSLEAAVEVHNIVQKIRHLQSLLDGE